MTARVVTDPGELHELFSRDPRKHLYALVDLKEPYWSASTWWRDGDAAAGLIRFPEGGRVLYALSSADVPGTRELVRDINEHVPPCQLVVATGCCAVLAAQGRTLPWRGTYTRYHLVDPAAVPKPDAAVVALHRDDIEEVQELYDRSPGAAFFLPHMLDDNTFVGLREGGLLVAVAGTHVISDDDGVAALGAIFTHPDHRGMGLGRTVTAAAIHRVANRVSTIGLNCADDNTTAIALYESMGFEAVMAFEESEITA